MSLFSHRVLAVRPAANPMLASPLIVDVPADDRAEGRDAAKQLVDELFNASKNAIARVGAVPVKLPPSALSIPHQLISGGSLFGRRSLMGGRGMFAAAAPRLGQLYNADYNAIYNGVKNALKANASPYDAFVAFCLETAPQSVAWEKSAFQVNEALKTFDANYAQIHSTAVAAAWGVRFPDDLRGDIAWDRIALAASEWDNLFLGHNSADPAARGYTRIVNTSLFPLSDSLQAALAVLDDKWGTVRLAYDLAVSDSLTGGSYTLDKGIESLLSLTGGPQALEFWYLHVYRALQAFIPAMAVYYQSGEASDSLGVNVPADVYAKFSVPNVSNSPRFVAWVLAANTFMFSRFNSPLALRGLMGDERLKDVMAGFEKANQILAAENVVLSAIGAANKQYINALETLQLILKVLAAPVTIPKAVVDKIVELTGGWGFLEWGLLAGGGLAALLGLKWLIG